MGIRNLVSQYRQILLKVFGIREASQIVISLAWKKEETFIVIFGTVYVKLDGKDHIFHAGDAITIEPHTPHCFEPVNGPAVILEASTHHEDSDTYRIEDSIAKENFLCLEKI